MAYAPCTCTLTRATFGTLQPVSAASSMAPRLRSRGTWCCLMTHKKLKKNTTPMVSKCCHSFRDNVCFVYKLPVDSPEAEEEHHAIAVIVC